MDVAQYRALFVEESREHLVHGSRLLVQLEGLAPPNTLVDELFRHMHSLKGMAASMRYEAIATLAHRVEEVIALHRFEQRRFGHSTIDLLLEAVEALLSQLDDVADGRLVQSHRDLLQSLTDELHLSRTGQAKAVEVEAPSSGGCLEVAVTISRECTAPSVRALLVHRKLSELAEVVATKPPMEALRRGEFNTRDLTFFLRQGVAPAAVEQVLQKISGLATFDIGLQTGQPRAAAKSQQTAALKDAAAEAPAKRAMAVRVCPDLLDELIHSVGDLFVSRERLRLGLAAPVDALGQGLWHDLDDCLAQVHQQLMAVRYGSMSSLLERYPEVVRDMASAVGKKINLVIDGADQTVDKTLLDHLDAALLHLLRNAVDHGIESSAQRLQRGKSGAGTISLRVSQGLDHVMCVVSDDGQGIDVEALKKMALQRGLLTVEKVEALSPEDTLALLCQPGFSTKAAASDLSGRGYGLDAVRRQMETLGGKLLMSSTFGMGATFSLRVPLTGTMLPVLLVEAGGRAVALPADQVAAVVPWREVSGSHETTAGGAPVVLAQALRWPVTAPCTQAVVMMDQGEKRVVGVEKILAQGDVAVRPVGRTAPQQNWLAGGIVTRDHRLVVVVDVARGWRCQWR